MMAASHETQGAIEHSLPDAALQHLLPCLSLPEAALQDLLPCLSLPEPQPP